MTAAGTPAAPAADPTAGTRRSLRRHIAGVGAIIAAALAAGAWTGATELSGAIIASGSLVVENKSQSDPVWIMESVTPVDDVVGGVG